MRKVTITTDGTPSGTHVTDAATGEAVHGIQRLQWDFAVHQVSSTALLTFKDRTEQVAIDAVPSYHALV